MKTLYFMFGLPGSGKSTWIKENCKGIPCISADDIKEAMKNFNPKSPEQYHQYSVKKAEEEYRSHLKNDESFVFDSGGINNHYSARLIQEARQAGWYIKLIHMDTPLAVCLKRNAERDRNVPEDNIIEKAVKMDRCLNNLFRYSDAYIKVSYYTNKYTFFDMDGTLAAYQFLPISSEGGIDFVDGEHFRYALPVEVIIEKAEGANSESFILSAIPDGNCLDHKREWLAKYCPFIKHENQFFIGNKRYKHEMLRNLLKRKKIGYQDVLVVDDDHRVLDELNAIGINAVHPSMYLCMDL
jgi:predicted kinase